MNVKKAFLDWRNRVKNSPSYLNGIRCYFNRAFTDTYKDCIEKLKKIRKSCSISNYQFEKCKIIKELNSLCVA